MPAPAFPPTRLLLAVLGRHQVSLSSGCLAVLQRLSSVGRVGPISSGESWGWGKAKISGVTGVFGLIMVSEKILCCLPHPFLLALCFKAPEKQSFWMGREQAPGLDAHTPGIAGQWLGAGLEFKQKALGSSLHFSSPQALPWQEPGPPCQTYSHHSPSSHSQAEGKEPLRARTKQLLTETRAQHLSWETMPCLWSRKPKHSDQYHPCPALPRRQATIVRGSRLQPVQLPG